MIKIVTLFFFLLTPSILRAGDNDRIKEVVRNDIYLMALDLIDELVHSWQTTPPFEQKTPVVLVNISTPEELNSVLKMVVSNRLTNRLLRQPKRTVELVYCQPCEDWLVVATPSHVVAQRGVENPQVLSFLNTRYRNHVGLSLHLVAEEDALVLRAFLFKLGGSQPLLWTRSFNTRLSAPRLLRSHMTLVSADDARREYLTLLGGQSVLKPYLNLNVRSYSSTQVDQVNTPFLEITQNFDTYILPHRIHRVGIGLSYLSMVNMLQGWGGNIHYAWLVTQQPSLIWPDPWLFFRLNYTRIQGPAATLFQTGTYEGSLEKLLTNIEPAATLFSYQSGIEVFAKNRLGFTAYIEYTPSLSDSELVSEIGYSFGAIIQW